MDIFGDDIDSFFNNDNELNENIRDDNIEEPDEDGDEKVDDDNKDENGEPIKVEAKKRSVRRPQVRPIHLHYELFELNRVCVLSILVALKRGAIEVRSWHSHR